MCRIWFDEEFKNRYTEAEKEIFMFFFTFLRDHKGIALKIIMKSFPDISSSALRARLYKLSQKGVIIRESNFTGSVETGKRYTYRISSMASKGKLGFVSMD